MVPLLTYSGWPESHPISAAYYSPLTVFLGAMLASSPPSGCPWGDDLEGRKAHGMTAQQSRPGASEKNDAALAGALRHQR